LENLKPKLKEYVIGIPENVTFSILPVLRWETSKGFFNSRTISDSIKIIRNINIHLLAEKIISYINDNILEYKIRDDNLELFIMGRPWLSVDEFSLDRFTDKIGLEQVFNDEIEKKFSVWTKSFDRLDSSDKTYRLKNYLLKDVYMDRYGEPVLDKNNNLIGYKIDKNKFASVETYYNNDNLLCNKVLIRDFDDNKKLFKGAAIFSWVDIKTENGFVREYNKNKYYYDKNNKLFNS